MNLRIEFKPFTGMNSFAIQYGTGPERKDAVTNIQGSLSHNQATISIPDELYESYGDGIGIYILRNFQDIVWKYLKNLRNEAEKKKYWGSILNNDTTLEKWKRDLINFKDGHDQNISIPITRASTYSNIIHEEQEIYPAVPEEYANDPRRPVFMKGLRQVWRRNSNLYRIKLGCDAHKVIIRYLRRKKFNSTNERESISIFTKLIKTLYKKHGSERNEPSNIAFKHSAGILYPERIWKDGICTEQEHKELPLQSKIIQPTKPPLIVRPEKIPELKAPYIVTSNALADFKRAHQLPHVTAQDVEMWKAAYDALQELGVVFPTIRRTHNDDISTGR